MGSNRPVERIPLYERERGSLRHHHGRLEARGRERRGDTPMELALQKLVQERDQLKEQLDVVRDLADRMMSVSEQGQARIVALERQLAEKDALLAAMEEENGALIQQISLRTERVSQLEATLTMLAQADEKLES